jgi:hypothetical protein
MNTRQKQFETKLWVKLIAFSVNCEKDNNYESLINAFWKTAFYINFILRCDWVL